MFTGGGINTSSSFGATVTPSSANPMKDFEVSSPPDDSISSLAFSPSSLPQNFLIAGSWDNNVRCWEVEQSGKTIPKSMQTMQGPVLDVCWSDDGTKVFMAACDKMVKCWDLASNQTIQVAAHDAPVKTCHWIKATNYSCLMTGSWDKTLKFWDTRSPQPIRQLPLPERCYCADVDYPMAVVGTAARGLIIYQLEGGPQEFKRVESPLKYQHRCVAIFRDKKNQPTGFALGSVEGRVAIQYVNPQNPKNNFTFKCHRTNGTGGYQDIYAFKCGRSAGQTTHNINVVWSEGSICKCTVQRWFQKFHLGDVELDDKKGHRRPSVVDHDHLRALVEENPCKTNWDIAREVNDIAFHPTHGTLATVGSDGTFSFWDKDARTKLKPSEVMEQPITRCAFSHNGQIFAYAVSYDWSKGHEFYNPAKKNYIFLRPCYEELKPRQST